jgi:hypothetical protein
MMLKFIIYEIELVGVETMLEGMKGMLVPLLMMILIR